MKLKWWSVAGVLVLLTACNRTESNQVSEASSYDPSTVTEASGEPKGTAEPEGTADPEGTAEPDASDATRTAAAGPTLTVANWDDTQKLVAQNAGKVVILDLWASW